MDLRYLAKAKFGADRTDSCIPGVLSFLEMIYSSVAENLPDVRDSSYDVEHDPYCDFSDLAVVPDDARKNSGPKSKAKRQNRAVPVAPDRTIQSGCEPRWLPPGSMKDYWVQYKQETAKPWASFPTFWRVWASHYSFMRFRAGSSHAQCTECLKHKLLVRALGHHLTARSMQQKLLYNHLQSQFADRCTYWRKRGLSRARGLFICCITDGMDQGKLAVPRHASMKAKQFDSWNRPRLHLAAVIAHGWCLNLYLSESNMPKDSNTCMEMLSHTLSIIKRKGCPLAEATVCIQADNTSREVKNGPTMRWVCSLVSDNLIKDGGLSFLRTGHSHEDIDQVFGQCADFVRRKLPTALSSADLQAGLNIFLEKLDRPFEPDRGCYKLDDARHWTPGFE